MKKFFVAVSALALSVASVSAASISGVSGPVSVNVGEGFALIEGAAELNVGDKVLVGEGGFASLTQGECTVAIDKPTVITITETPICSADQVAVLPTADIDAGGAGVGGAGGGVGPVAAGLGFGPLLILGTVTAGTTFFLAKKVFGKKDRPASANGAPAPVLN